MNIGNKKQKKEKKIAIFYITKNSLSLAERLKRLYPDASIIKFRADIVGRLWAQHKKLIFIMAAGIVVRTIATLIKDKKTDPAVIVLDENGKFVISLLSGHLGGANELAKEIANFLNGEAVITTASDVNDLPSIDLWAKENDFIIENMAIMPHVATRYINNRALCVYSEVEAAMSDKFLKVSEPGLADVLITNKIFKAQNSEFKEKLFLRPKNLVIGVGCNIGTSAEDIEEAVKTVFNENNLSFLSIHSISTINIKDSEQGLRVFAEKYGFKINTYTADELNSVEGIRKSEPVFKATGAKAVSEPAALLASCASKLLIAKQKIGNVTVAVAEKNNSKFKIQNSKILQPSAFSLKPKLYIVGTGPGSIRHITPYAQDAIKRSDFIVGYDTYLELVQELIKDKEVLSTGMTQEIDRCKKAVQLARAGKTVSVISGGDPGIYAMAGLVFELLRASEQQSNSAKCLNKNFSPSDLPHCGTAELSIEVIPGISALNACAARLGAPLMHDFAVISLSDRLTDWQLIEKRLKLAAEGDFVTVLYNPKSKGRQDYINKAQEIFKIHRKPDTPVGIVKGAMRENEQIIITTLSDMLNHDIDMQTTVVIGNSQTFVWHNYMITPRGYEKRFKVLK